MAIKKQKAAFKDSRNLPPMCPFSTIQPKNVLISDGRKAEAGIKAVVGRGSVSFMAKYENCKPVEIWLQPLLSTGW